MWPQRRKSNLVLAAGWPGRSICEKSCRYKNQFPALAAILIPVTLTTGHMIVFNYFWGHSKKPVDPNCTCACWDTVFKGPYESGHGRYKHVYFNVTRNSFCMWALTIVALVGLYESLKKLFELCTIGHLRVSMTLLILASLHSHYYGWWAFWGYWNDEFYVQWNHQLFFTLTELMSTLLAFGFLDLKKPIQPLCMLLICNIAVFHIFTSSWDQFVANVIAAQGQLHQVLRDVPTMFTDILNLAISTHEVKSYARARKLTFCSVCLHKFHILALIVLSSAMSVWFICLFQIWRLELEWSTLTLRSALKIRVQLSRSSCADLMDCADLDPECWSAQPPDVPPAPPLPPFLSIDLIRSGINSSWGCDLCFWAHPPLVNSPGSLPFVTLLIIVATVSALAGASLTATLLSIRRWRNRRSIGMSASVCNLTRNRKPDADTSSAGTTSSFAAFGSSSVSANTYCEGPFNEKLSCTNIYAELHLPSSSNKSSVWNRPPLPTPTEDCYLELADLPSEPNLSSCTSSTPVTWFQQSSSSTPLCVD